jgi:hypothetical protein
MSRTFTEIKIYVAADKGDDGLSISTDSLDGGDNMVQLRFGEEGEGGTNLGWFDIDQLINSLSTIKNHRIQFVGMRKEEHDFECACDKCVNHNYGDPMRG